MSCVLSGSNSPFLGSNIAQQNNLLHLENRVVHFVNAEMKVTLPADIKNHEQVTVVQSTSNPANDNLMELLLTVDTLKREKVSQIDVVIPYFGYARQDKQHLPLECISVETICNLIRSVGVRSIYTTDIHNTAVLERINAADSKLFVTNVTCIPILAKSIYQILEQDGESESDFTIVSPDTGGIPRAQIFADHFYQNPEHAEVVSIKKKRSLDRTDFCEAVELKGEIVDQKVILVDDVSTSGSTLLNALELCKANLVKEVYGVVVHADFGPQVAEKLQNSDFTKIFVSNSIEKTVDNLEFYSKIVPIDISQVFDFIGN